MLKPQKLTDLKESSEQYQQALKIQSRLSSGSCSTCVQHLDAAILQRRPTCAAVKHFDTHLALLQHVKDLPEIMDEPPDLAIDATDKPIVAVQAEDNGVCIQVGTMASSDPPRTIPTSSSMAFSSQIARQR